MSRTHDLSAEDVRASLWFWPSVAAGCSLLLAMALLLVRPDPASTFATWAWPGDAASASTLLQVVATAVMTAMTLTFSLTVVALQLASQQFSPRLLREFARDRLTQAVLALLVSTFVVSLTGLRGMDPDRPLPVVLVSLVLVLGVASAAALLAFIGHLVRALRVDTMMVAVHKEAAQTSPTPTPRTTTPPRRSGPACPAPRAARCCRRSAAGSSGPSHPGGS